MVLNTCKLWWQSAIAKGRYHKGPLSQRAAITKVCYRKSRYCHVMYKLLYPSIRVRTTFLYRLGSGLGLVLVLILRFCMCPAVFCDSGPESKLQSSSTFYVYCCEMKGCTQMPMVHVCVFRMHSVVSVAITKSWWRNWLSCCIFCGCCFASWRCHCWHRP